MLWKVASCLPSCSASFAPDKLANVCRCLARFCLMIGSCSLLTLLAMKMIGVLFVCPDVDNLNGWVDPRWPRNVLPSW